MNEEKREETMMFSQEGTENPKLNSKDLLLSLAAILVSACILSGAIPSAFVGLASLALFVYAVIAIRNAGAIIQLVLSALIATVLTFLPICGAAVLALVIGTGVLAWLFITLPKYKWAPISLLVVAYALGFLVSADVITPLLSLAFLPAAALMAWAHARDLGRTATVLHAFLGFLVTVLATLCVLLLRTYGAVNYDVLMTFVADLKAIFVTIGTEAGKILWESIEAQSAALPADSLEKLRASYAQVFSESNLQVTADTLMGLAPALVGVPALIVSYLSGVVLLRKYYNTEWRSRMTRAACTLDISPAAAVIYVLCMVLVIFINKQSVFLMAITNMFFLLMPALALTGVNVVLFNARRAQGWVGKASVVLLVAAACCMGINCLYFLALWGAYVIVSSALHQKILQKMKDQNEK
jgi:hypothetical protein